MRPARTDGITMGGEVGDIAYDVCVYNSIISIHPVQRRFQDVHVINQQVQGRLAHYDTAGQFFLGLEPEGLF